MNFNPRTPCGVRLMASSLPSNSSVFQSTHPMRGATRRTQRPAWQSNFNPRTPCGVRLEDGKAALDKFRFQSTHPMRGATESVTSCAPALPLFQSTHPMRGATYTLDMAYGSGEFQSPHPMRGATEFSSLHHVHSLISIHAPHAGCD